MYSISFEKLKTKATNSFLEQFSNFNPDHVKLLCLALSENALFGEPFSFKNVEETVEEWKSAGVRLIDNWDIRVANRLIVVFPGIIPTKYANKNYSANINDSGEWMLYWEGECHDEN